MAEQPVLVVEHPADRLRGGDIPRVDDHVDLPRYAGHPLERMQIAQGRHVPGYELGHIGLNVTDLPRAKEYFDELMPMLALEPFFSTVDQFSYRPASGEVGATMFFYPALEAGTYSRYQPGLQHLAFVVRSRAIVDQIHGWARGRGDEVIHPPREFPEYHPGYYATFWYGPEEFMLEAVCHRDENAASASR